MYNSPAKGFTLIELLVVISIIGLLSSIVLTSLGTVRAKAYDARRVTDLTQVQTALEFYYSNNGSYPSTAGQWTSECALISTTPKANVIPGLTPTYLPTIPSDPQMNAANGTCCYMYRSDRTDYKFLAAYTCTAAASPLCWANAKGTTGFSDPARSKVCSIYTPGAADW